MTDLIGNSLGRYHILERLGEGGMAIVYKAFDTRLEADVAVKVIRMERITPETLTRTLTRFEREAKALAKLTHPNIVKVTDYGDEDNQPYLVMEYLPGGTLKQRMGQPVPWQDAARLLIPVASALDYAHKHGVLHRDVKPSNILVTDSGALMLSDFGIAKILDAADGQTLTGTGVGVGTPEYMSPEQGLGKSIDGRTDIYSLGVVLYELITGHKPYTADTPMAVVLKQATEPLPRPIQYIPDLPEESEQVLIKALAKEPDNRYADMTAFNIALEKLAGTQTAVLAIAPPTIETKKQSLKEILTTESVVEDELHTGDQEVEEEKNHTQRVYEKEDEVEVQAGDKYPSEIYEPVTSSGWGPPHYIASQQAEKTANRLNPLLWLFIGLMVLIGGFFIGGEIHQTNLEHTATARAYRVTRTAKAEATSLAATATQNALNDFLSSLTRNSTLLQKIDQIRLEHKEDNFVSTYFIGEYYENYILEADFVTPYNADEHAWDFGFVFRSLDGNDNYRLIIHCNGSWRFDNWTGSSSTNKTISSGAVTLATIKDQVNTLKLIDSTQTCYFYVNDVFIQELDCSSRSATGNVQIATGLFDGSEWDGHSTIVKNIRLWKFDQ